MSQTSTAKSKLSGRYRTFFFHVVALCAICAIGFFIYSNTLNSPFVLDDESSIVNNPHIRLQNLDFTKLWNAGFKSVAHRRPLPNISFALNYIADQYNERGYHIVNTLIHIISGFLIYLFIRITFIISSTPDKDYETFNAEDSFYASVFAFCTALVWLAHPIQTQAVTYIVQRMTSMAVMFYMLSLLLYIYARRTEIMINRWLLFSLSLVSWLVSLACKEISATLPLIIFLYEWFFFRNLNFEWLKRNIKYFILPLLIIVILAFVYLGDSPIERILSRYETRDFTLSGRVMTQFRVILLYVSLLIYPLPSRFNLDYQIETSLSFFDPITTLFSFIVIIICIGGAVYLASKERLLSFCIFWFFINLSMESSVIGLEMVFEHRLYLPSIGFFVLVMFILFRLVSYVFRKEKDMTRRNNRAAKYVLLVSIPLILLLSLATYQRNSVWRDEITLWRDCVKKSPGKARCHNNLGRSYYREGIFEEAEQEYKKALALDPEYFHAYNNLGSVYASMEKYDEAIEQYQQGLSVNPGSSDLWYNIANIYKVSGYIDEAIQHYQQALSLNPNEARAHYELGGIYLNNDLYEKAEKEYTRALTINPYYIEAYHNLGNVYQKSGRLEEAMLIYKKVLGLNPEIIESYNNLAILYFKMDQFKESIALLKEALKIDPDNSTVHYNLGNIYHEKGMRDEAIAEYNTSLRNKPDNLNAHYRLAILYKEAGQFDNAVKEYKEVLKEKPDSIEALNSIGNIHFESGNIDEAINSYRKILEIDPRNNSVHFNLGNAYYRKGMLDRALEEYTTSLQIKPDSENARYKLATLYKKMGNVDKAIHEYKNLTDSNPDNPLYHYKLGNTYKDAGRLNDAVFEYQKALEMKPDMGEALNNLATILMLNGRDEEALQLLKKKIDLYPESVDAYYNIACIYSKQNRIDEALSWINAAISRGFREWKLLETDSDLANLRNSPQYKEVLKNK
ncbi:MAG: tetratricopeptide repeat protein [Deltaproteobacteria bacterium]|nr:tetratricopeptide repeat protein [Deltaproteobacteria bacterium]